MCLVGELGLVGCDIYSCGCKMGRYLGRYVVFVCGGVLDMGLYARDVIILAG